MKITISLIVILLTAGKTLADDPGVRDSLIIETVYAEMGDSSVDVRIFATSDDSVGFYNIPITWYAQDSAIYPTAITYHNTVIYWDSLIDAIMYNSGLIRMLGFCDVAGPSNPPLVTDNIREHCWTIHFSISTSATPQLAVIDTTFDPMNGSLLFGLEGGVHELTPVFLPGAIFYGITSDIGDDRPVPHDFALRPNYPNPFNASTAIDFTLPVAADIEISVYNILGQKVAVLFDDRKPAGEHSVIWDAGDLPSGIYFARLEAPGHSKNVKMILLK